MRKKVKRMFLTLRKVYMRVGKKDRAWRIPGAEISAQLKQAVPSGRGLRRGWSVR